MEATSPSLGCGEREGQGRGADLYRRHSRSPHPPPPQSSSSSARAVGARARPRLRPPSAAGPSGGCSFREAGLRGPPPGHVGGGGSQNGARGQMFAILSAQPFPYVLAVNGLKSPHIQLDHTIPPLSTDKFLEKISLNSLSPVPSSSTRQLLPPQKVVLLPSLMSSNLSFRHHLTLLDIITYFLTLFRFSFFLSGHSSQSPSTILFLTCFLNISVHKNSWRTLIFKCPFMSHRHLKCSNFKVTLPSSLFTNIHSNLQPRFLPLSHSFIHLCPNGHQIV